MTMKLLIADDAHDIAEVVAFGARMTWPGCQVTIAGSGTEALQQFAHINPDLVILDVAMPPPDGFEVCRRIRDMPQVPVLMLTVHDGTLDKVRALDLGADDYLTKPFDHLELLARLRALVRRTQTPPVPSSATLAVGHVTLDAVTHAVRLGDMTVRLTSTEYHLLETLMRHAGSVLGHQFLLE